MQKTDSYPSVLIDNTYYYIVNITSSADKSLWKYKLIIIINFGVFAVDSGRANATVYLSK